MAAFTTLLASFDGDAGKRGKQFEHFVKWFLQNDPEWSTQVDQVWLWEEYPDRWGIDCGIDLVFRHKNGESWAVQAKCYSQQHDITKHDVDKFLSESNRKGIDKRLLIATTDRLGANAKQVCDAQEKSVFRYLLSNFESANLDYPAKLADLHTAKRKTKPTPRDHQLEAIDGVVSSFHGTDRGQLIMACGTGKTFTTLWIKERLGATSTLILLPSLGLLSQTLHEWTLAANQAFEVLCVCSDETVGKKGSDEAIHSITDVAFPVTSNVEDIRKFLNRSGAKVVFSTYQSSPLVAEAQGVTTVPDFDLAIADEAHRCAGKVGNDFTTILDAKLIRATKRLFATATPRTYSTNIKKAAGECGIDVVGMDDEAVFGKVSYSLPFGQAIKRGLLTDYQVVIIGVDNPTIAAWIENRELVKTESGIEIDAESLAAQIGLLKAYKDYDLHRVISFHSRVKRAEQFSKDLIDVIGWIGDEHKPSGAMKTDFVSGEMATDKRRIKLARLKSLAPQERGLLTNARCLSEGVDVPSLDGVAFVDPRSSQIDIIQAVGRAIRLSANKTTGTIILPVFIEAGIDAQSSIEDSNFKPIWDVLNALKAHDDVLSAELDEMRSAIGRTGGASYSCGAMEKIVFDLPTTADSSFQKSLQTTLVEQVTDSWFYWYGKLIEYVEDHGDSLVPQRYICKDGAQLGAWLGWQRKSKELRSATRIEMLERLPGWAWSVLDEKWEYFIEQLRIFIIENGHSAIPRGFLTPDGLRLDVWVGTQRNTRKDLSADRIRRLEEIEGWTWDVLDDRWKSSIAALKSYAEQYGHSLVAASYVFEDGFRLGSWVSLQRSKRNKLPFERRIELEAVAKWSWNPIEDQWEHGFGKLSEYVKCNSSSRVSISYTTASGFKLGSWVGSQRRNFSALSPEKRIRLEALPDWTWNDAEDRWKAAFAYLMTYQGVNGHCRVPALYVTDDGYRLGQWLTVQRTTKEKLSKERIELLESVQGWVWNELDEKWQIGISHLREYVEQFGNSNVTTGFVCEDGYRLGNWVGSARRKQMKLEPHRREELESFKGWAWDPLQEQWEAAFKELQNYERQFGNLLVPQDYVTTSSFTLGVWVSYQRGRRLKMTAERRSRLEGVKGWVWSTKK